MHPFLIISDDVAPNHLQDINDFINEWKSDNKTISVHTSGSTGTPKSIFLSKENVRASAKATGRFFNLKSDENVLLNLSANYIAGKLMIVRALEHQMKIIVAPIQNNPLSVKIPEKVAFGAFVPYQIEQILGDQNSRSQFEKIKNVIIGGAPVSSSLEKGLMELDNTCWATFGMTETITHFALRNISKGDEFFECLPGIEVSSDERGCLVIDENDVFSRQVTNDLVDIISPTRFLWKGRWDYVVNSGGVKLSPELLERKVGDEILGVRFYFSGRQSEKWGQELILVMESQPKEKESIFDALKTRLEGYEVPKDIVFLDKFEETPTGKVKRRRF